MRFDRSFAKMLNTGGVGEIMTKRGRKVIIEQRALRPQIWETASIVRGLVRGTIKWTYELYFGTMVPSYVEGVDVEKFKLENFYSREQIENLVTQLKLERANYLVNNYPSFVESVQLTSELAKFTGLDVIGYDVVLFKREEPSSRRSEVLHVIDHHLIDRLNNVKGLHKG